MSKSVFTRILLLVFPAFLFSCSSLAPAPGIGGSKYEIAATFNYVDDYRDEKTGVNGAPPDTPGRQKYEETLTLYAQGSQFVSKNLSIGLTADYKKEDTEYLTEESSFLFLLASPRYYFSMTEDDDFALYIGPDLGIVFLAASNDGEDFTGEAPAYGLTGGSKFYIGDHFALFAELYKIYFEREDSDGFSEDIDQLGLRIGFSVMW